jgi:transcriptional regulator with XRE-family HTH domain
MNGPRPRFWPIFFELYESLARELGVSYATVNRWENGQAKPSKLARAQLDTFCDRMQRTGVLDLSEKGHGQG